MEFRVKDIKERLSLLLAQYDDPRYSSKEREYYGKILIAEFKQFIDEYDKLNRG
jgi:hypothetical protein